MGIGHAVIIILFSGFTGLLVAWLLIGSLFRPLHPVSIGPVRWQGIIPGQQKYFAMIAGNAIQSAFVEYKGLDEQVSGPALLQKLRPQIEEHVDRFLQEKLKTVFPVLAQFMGEKTLGQFKQAFMAELDILFPQLMKNYMHELKAGIDIGAIVTEKINDLSMERLGVSFHSAAAKQVRKMMLAGAFIGIFTGLLTVLLLFLINI